MSCPFCNDERLPEVIEVCPETSTEKPVFQCACLCCGAQGPCSSAKDDARLLWDFRSTASSSAWREAFRKETGG
jgi:hypothetical protein